jgi:hypothetical protein
VQIAGLDVKKGRAKTGLKKVKNGSPKALKKQKGTGSGKNQIPFNSLIMK